MNLTDTARRTLLAHPVAHLRDLAREAGIAGRSRMRKAELAEALIPAALAEMALVAANRRRASYARSFPAVTPGEVVTEGHAQWCRDFGHATHAVAGVVQPRCPRCDEPREAPARLTDDQAARFAQLGAHSRGEGPAPVPAEVPAPTGFSYSEVSSYDNHESPARERFATLPELRSYVQRDLRGISSIYQVRVYDAQGVRIGRGYRSGYNGTGNRWVWELPN